jgi:hypothetical protein
LLFIVVAVSTSSLQAGEPQHAHVIVYDGWGWPEAFGSQDASSKTAATHQPRRR